MIVRYSKITLVWSIALFATLVVFNNLDDYCSNYQFVSHVLKMDTTFPSNNGSWRAIDSPLIFHGVYIAIILTEAAVAILCWLGGWQLLRSVHDANQFARSKGIAIIGLILGILLWFVGFIAIGGEWFLMWQSKIWNGQQAAFRISMVIGMVLLYLNLPEQ